MGKYSHRFYASPLGSSCRFRRCTGLAITVQWPGGEARTAPGKFFHPDRFFFFLLPLFSAIAVATS
jgi:hypothetical protein